MTLRLILLLPAILMVLAASRHVLAWNLCPVPSAQPAQSADGGHDCCESESDVPGSGHDCCKVQQATPPAPSLFSIDWNDVPLVDEPIALPEIDFPSFTGNSGLILFHGDSSPPNPALPCHDGRAPPAL